jgi:NADPH:quinone reductase-like Zn-dependent oxidoreductase
VRAVALEAADSGVSVMDVPAPEPGDEELLVRVRTASINPADLRVATGNYPWGKFTFPAVLGFDFAGEVESVGAGVSSFEVGDEVLGFWSRGRYHDGSWAEYIAVPEAAFVVRKPFGMTFEQAAALPLAATTAAQIVDDAALRPGDDVLIVGATGSIGGYAVQLAARTGANVIATSKPGREQRLRELGAAELVDYKRKDVVETVPVGLAALIDIATESKDEVTRLASLVRDGGHVASACFAADVDALGRRGIAAANVITTRCDPSLLARVVELVEAGELRIAYDQVRPLERVPAAVDELWGGPSAKVVVAIANGTA